MFSVPLFSWWQWVCASAILKLTSNNPAKGNWVSFKKVGQRMWSRLISLNNLVKLKLKQKIHIQHCVFHAPLLLRKRCSPVPKFPLPCYLNCSNFFTAPICHCASWTHIPVHILDYCIFPRKCWQGWKGPLYCTLQVQHILLKFVCFTGLSCRQL